MPLVLFLLEGFRLRLIAAAIFVFWAVSWALQLRHSRAVRFPCLTHSHNSNPFRINTCGVLRKRGFKRTYENAKPFGIDVYQKNGGVPQQVGSMT
jgi:hypothetical protein